jgi:hypothetical protein
MLRAGDVVTFHNPGNKREHESWQCGVIVKTIARYVGIGKALHVVRLDAHKWDAEAPWGPYDGVPEVIGREVNGRTELEWVGQA